MSTLKPHLHTTHLRAVTAHWFRVSDRDYVCSKDSWWYTEQSTMQITSQSFTRFHVTGTDNVKYVISELKKHKRVTYVSHWKNRECYSPVSQTGVLVTQSRWRSATVRDSLRLAVVSVLGTSPPPDYSRTQGTLPRGVGQQSRMQATLVGGRRMQSQADDSQQAQRWSDVETGCVPSLANQSDRWQHTEWLESCWGRIQTQGCLEVLQIPPTLTDLFTMHSQHRITQRLCKQQSIQNWCLKCLPTLIRLIMTKPDLHCILVTEPNLWSWERQFRNHQLHRILIKTKLSTLSTECNNKYIQVSVTNTYCRVQSATPAESENCLALTRQCPAVDAEASHWTLVPPPGEPLQSS